MLLSAAHDGPIPSVIKANKCLPGCECCWHGGLSLLLLSHSCMEATYGVWSFGPSCSVDWYTDGLTSLTVLYSPTSQGGKDGKR